MYQKCMLGVLSLLAIVFMVGCDSSSSSNPSSSNTVSDIVGTWRFVGGAYQFTPPQFTAHYQPDSAYLVINANGTFVYEAKPPVTTQKMYGHWMVTSTSLVTIVDSLRDFTQPFSDTIRVGDTLRYTYEVDNVKLLLHGTMSTGGNLKHHAYIRSGLSTVTMAGFTISMNGIGMGSIPVTINTDPATSLTYSATSNSWGFWYVTGMQTQTYRPQGFANGITYGGGTTYPCTANGVYPVALFQ